MSVTINKRKNSGDWYIWISHKGKRTSRKIGPDKRTAEKAAKEYRRKLALGEVDFTNGYRGLRTDSLVGRFFREYLEKIAKNRLKRNSWESYERIEKLHLLPKWENVQLKEINRQDAKDLLLEKQGKGLSVQNIAYALENMERPVP